MSNIYIDKDLSNIFDVLTRFFKREDFAKIFIKTLNKVLEENSNIISKHEYIQNLISDIKDEYVKILKEDGGI